MTLCSHKHTPKNNKEFKIGEVWEVVSADEEEIWGDKLIDWTNRVRQVFKILNIKNGYAYCKTIQYINGKLEDFYTEANLKNKTPAASFKVKIRVVKFANWRLAPNLA